MKLNKLQEVLISTKKVLVDFYSTHCGPCKAMGPVVDRLITEMNNPGQMEIVKINIDHFDEAADYYMISAVPTFIFFEDGLESKRVIGMMSEKAIKDQLNG